MSSTRISTAIRYDCTNDDVKSFLVVICVTRILLFFKFYTFYLSGNLFHSDVCSIRSSIFLPFLYFIVSAWIIEVFWFGLFRTCCLCPTQCMQFKMFCCLFVFVFLLLFCFIVSVWIIVSVRFLFYICFCTQYNACNLLISPVLRRHLKYLCFFGRLVLYLGLLLFWCYWLQPNICTSPVSVSPILPFITM